MRNSLFVGGIAFLGFISVASATPVGTLTTNGCPGNQVQVTAGSIDWEPVGGGTGCIVTGGATSITHAGLGGPTLGGSVTGTILDLPAGPPGAPVLNFMTFTGHSVAFDLLGIGPGSSNTDCSTTKIVNNGDSCSIDLSSIVGPGVVSPFLLTKSGASTIVSLNAFGVAHDGDGGLGSLWSGQFTVSITNQLPSDIQATILAGGIVTSTEAGDFRVSAIPEPASFALIGLGLGGLGLMARRKRQS